MARPKSFDVTLKVKITKTQDAMLDMLSDYTGITKSRLVREMLDMEFASTFLRKSLADLAGVTGLADEE